MPQPASPAKAPRSVPPASCGPDGYRQRSEIVVQRLMAIALFEKDGVPACQHVGDHVPGGYLVMLQALRDIA